MEHIMKNRSLIVMWTSVVCAFLQQQLSYYRQDARSTCASILLGRFWGFCSTGVTLVSIGVKFGVQESANPLSADVGMGPKLRILWYFRICMPLRGVSFVLFFQN